MPPQAQQGGVCREATAQGGGQEAAAAATKAMEVDTSPGK